MSASDSDPKGVHVRSGRWLALVASGVLSVGALACGGGEGGGSGAGELSGKIAIDGSSTVGPLAQAAAEVFREENREVDVTVGTSGTGGGFEKFCAGEIDIATASRPIKEDVEVPVCRRNGVSYKEIQAANDGIAVVTNKQTPIDCMTTKELRKLWDRGSDVQNFKDIDPKFPDQKVSLFGPGTDSGTFDFFTEEINGEEGVTRRDYQPSEDDNVLVQGVSQSPGGLGYFGFSYYEQNQAKLNAVGIDAGDGCVKPSARTIQSGQYEPLSRPLYMYVSDKALQRPEVEAFMRFFIENQQEIAEIAQIVPMTPEQAAKGQKLLTGA